MKVCHVVPGYFPYYSAHYEYTRHLARLGVDVSVFAFRRPGQAAEDHFERVKVRRVDLRTASGFSPRNSYSFISFVLREMAEESFDLAHVYAFRVCSLLPLLGNRLSTRWLMDLRTGNVASKGLRSRLANWTTRQESRIFQARGALDTRVGKKVLGSRPFTVLPIGVDLQRFTESKNPTLRRRLGFSDDDLVVIYTGKFEPLRYPERIISAFADARARVPRLALLMVGEGSLIDALKQQCIDLGVRDSVVFTGYVPFKSVQDFIGTADIGLAYVPDTPEYRLQPPLKTAEFLAAGLPVVATSTLGNKTFVRDGVNGLVAQDSVESIAAQLTVLGQHPERRHLLSSRARESVRAHDWKEIVENTLLPLYRTVIGTIP